MIILVFEGRLVVIFGEKIIRMDSANHSVLFGITIILVGAVIMYLLDM